MISLRHSWDVKVTMSDEKREKGREKGKKRIHSQINADMTSGQWTRDEFATLLPESSLEAIFHEEREGSASQ